MILEYIYSTRVWVSWESNRTRLQHLHRIYYKYKPDNGGVESSTHVQGYG
jgi:hypothetical protein